ncbi:epidermis-specific secreted glycoprotein EP1-like [Thalictrum thalictroides]|uniref:Epidermis-specific secreted glycoprotein EP1-like n=1 Tax=Thalictrum thalictroides TaxID=46969 RepID=A0A7J6W468_THATH|nr:epidermis-specific secreted glycoprotein EP1-like [Thalictrum thalictroides]
MSTTTPSQSFQFSCIFIFITLSFVAQAIVPTSNTFKYINQGGFGEYSVEYGADYRTLSVSEFPFQLCFYNTTPNAFTLSVRMGNRHSESIMRWVWDANRGNPVRENATLTFGTDGNLVLADADGRVAWQTGTANKGVVGLKLLSNGNLVLQDNRGRFVWQSFDYPTDTLLVGQALRLSGPTKFVSRVSDVDGSEGPYSFVLDKKRIALYLIKSKNSPKPAILYYIAHDFPPKQGIDAVVFNSEPANEGFASEIKYDLWVGNSSVASRFVGRPKYNSTLSILRLGSDGSLKVYTYNDKVDWGAWEVTYSAFDKDGVYGVSECKLPTRCGSLGVCEDSQCVACPRPQGLLGWSKDCAPPRLPPCKGAVDYYKVVGVEHFTSDYTQGDGPIKQADCREKCTKDCGCLGFFYREESSKCLLAPELGTLTKVSNQTHVAYIKMSK